jgi:hypothetical protein
MPGPGLQVGWGRPGWRVWAALALGCLVVVVVLVARLTGDGAPRTDAGPVAPSGASPPSTAAAPSTSVSPPPDDGVHGSTSAVPEGAVAAGTSFVRAWVAHAPPTTAAQWWQRVSRHADPTLAQQLRAVDLTDIPANRVTGPATGTVLSPTSAEIRVPTDGGTVVVLCVLVDSRWLAATVDVREPT